MLCFLPLIVIDNHHINNVLFHLLFYTYLRIYGKEKNQKNSTIA